MTRDDARLVEVGNGVFAYEQPDGGWGLSNAGLVVSAGKGLLVDTLFDRAHTRRMLDAMAGASSAAIEVIVNTHDNGDHCYGNELLQGRRIVSSLAAATDMKQMPAKKLAMLMSLARTLSSGDPNDGKARALRQASRLLSTLRLGIAADFLDAAPFVVEMLGRFSYGGIKTVLPTETFVGKLTLLVEGRVVELMEVGPAHTRGDVAVWVPDARVLFTGDLVFTGAHPLAWVGTPSSCAEACDRLLALGPENVVPGHGSLADSDALRTQAAYYRELLKEARPLHDASVPVEEAALRLAKHGFGPERERSRLVVNVRAAYREFGRGAKGVGPVSPIREFGAMARLSAALGGSSASRRRRPDGRAER